ncbi:hypothetical protein B0H14DRAFT_2626986 [Mycena olivaceomarginata]|nr:hypothetical protein B0H14DRAFT_2626986 [Mycena olivaceomarginata]
MSLPQAEKRLAALFGRGYVPNEWSAGLNDVMNAEGDIVRAEQAVRALMPDFSPISSVISSPIASDRHLREAESALTEVLQQMREHHCLRGDVISLDELLDPVIEQEDQDSEFLHFGDQADGTTPTKEIVELIKQGELEEEDPEEEDPEESEFKFKSKDAMAAAELLQQIVQHRPDLDMALPLGRFLREFRAAMAQEGEESKIQTNITSFFTLRALPDDIPYDVFNCIIFWDHYRPILDPKSKQECPRQNLNTDWTPIMMLGTKIQAGMPLAEFKYWLDFGSGWPYHLLGPLQTNTRPKIQAGMPSAEFKYWLDFGSGWPYHLLESLRTNNDTQNQNPDITIVTSSKKNMPVAMNIKALQDNVVPMIFTDTRVVFNACKNLFAPLNGHGVPLKGKMLGHSARAETRCTHSENEVTTSSVLAGFELIVQATNGTRIKLREVFEGEREQSSS